MAQYMVFSKATVGGSTTELEEVWKSRGKVTAGSENEAMQLVADTDALDKDKGATLEYSACRDSAWRTRDFVFSTFARPLDNGEPML